ncbi:hypothetical protein FM107_18360 [Sphingobacterium sp. JB170]|nr:hypothetical protein FM107_18360 [Sphingobacterium sp. JB170]
MIWLVFEMGNIAEGKFARSMDYFEPHFKNVSNNWGTWAE